MRLGRHLRRGGSALLTSTLLTTALAVVAVQQSATPPAVVEAPATTQASSGSTYLCTGYAGCRAAGYSDAGYGAVNDRMYWRMYPGHNCTNYAAYRMIRAGMPNERPWSGGGNASEWGLEMRHITDQVPAVGAIAWWGRYQNGHGSAGHVAYVERVVSANEIIISEDAWGGDFHWRRITRDSGRWPGGFIHFVDKAITNTGLPTIVGTPQVGVPLKAKRGNWRPQVEVSFQWFADGERIPGATGQWFTPGPDQRGARLTAAVTARRPDFTPTTVRTAPTAAVARGVFEVVEPPTIRGEPLVDEQLRATSATFSPQPERTVYRWLADGEVIEGATGPTLTLTRSLVGKAIRVTTAARAEGYRNAPVRSPRVGPVLVGEITTTQPFTVDGTPRVGEQLTVVRGATDPADAEVAYQWLRDGAPVRRATGPRYDLAAADLDADISLRVTLTRHNYETRVETVPVGTVTTVPRVGVRAEGRSGRAVVVVRVEATGIDPAPGAVTVKVGAETASGRLVDGRVRMVVDRLAAGLRSVRVWYAGEGGVEDGDASTTVRVLR